MNDVLTLASAEELADLTVFLERAKRLGAEQVALKQHKDVVTGIVPVITREGLLDRTPDVLGMRVMASPDIGSVDRVVTLAGMLDRLARGELSFPLPVAEIGVAWAGISPPASEWVEIAQIPAAQLAEVAAAGIDEIAQANGLGVNIVSTVRKEVWSRNITVDDPDVEVPAGAAFAALGLGLLGPESSAAASVELVRILRSGSWGRLALERGHVLWH